MAERHLRHAIARSVQNNLRKAQTKEISLAWVSWRWPVNLTVILVLNRNRDDQFAGAVENRADRMRDLRAERMHVNSFPGIELAHRGSLFLREIENLLLQEQELLRLPDFTKITEITKIPRTAKP